MTCLEWNRQITALRAGKLRLLEPPTAGGLSQFARGHVDDLSEYLKALEAGYRAVCETLDGYRKRERTGAVKCHGKTLGELVSNQWSKPAALGYAAMTLRQSGMSPMQAIGILELMEDLMDEQGLQDAEAYYASLQADPGGNSPPGHGAHCAPLQKEGEEP